MVGAASKIMLGTAQFGLDYGIASTAGKVSYGEARGMVEYGLRRGMNSFDTAPGYGDSEEILGRIFRELGVSGEDVFVSDKIPPVPVALPKKETEEFIRGSVFTSLERLGLESMDVCLFHREKDAVLLEELLKLKEEGFVKEAGVSVYYPKPALDLIGKGFAGALQVPASALDRRFLSAGVFKRAEKKGITVFIRSAYLQGLMLMGEENVPESLSEARSAVKVLARLAGEAGVERSELALRYALALPGGKCVIAGADNIVQFENTLDIAEKGPLEPGLIQRADEALPELSEKVILPFNWEKKIVC